MRSHHPKSFAAVVPFVSCHGIAQEQIVTLMHIPTTEAWEEPLAPLLLQTSVPHFGLVSTCLTAPVGPLSGIRDQGSCLQTTPSLMQDDHCGERNCHGDDRYPTKDANSCFELRANSSEL